MNFLKLIYLKKKNKSQGAFSLVRADLNSILLQTMKNHGNNSVLIYTALTGIESDTYHVTAQDATD